MFILIILFIQVLLICDDSIYNYENVSQNYFKKQIMAKASNDSNGECGQIEKCRSLDQITAIAFCLMKSKYIVDSLPVVSDVILNQSITDAVKINIIYHSNSVLDSTTITLCIPVDNSKDSFFSKSQDCNK